MGAYYCIENEARNARVAAGDSPANCRQAEILRSFTRQVMVRSCRGSRGRVARDHMVHIWFGVSHAVNYPAMRTSPRSLILGLLLCLGLSAAGFSSAYNARPKLVVIIVIDQFRGDYLERYRDQWGEGGFRLLLEHGADFTDCNYDYANTRTAPGHATLLTGAYINGHGIMANEWWDRAEKGLGRRGRR